MPNRLTFGLAAGLLASLSPLDVDAKEGGIQQPTCPPEILMETGDMQKDVSQDVREALLTKEEKKRLRQINERLSDIAIEKAFLESDRQTSLRKMPLVRVGKSDDLEKKIRELSADLVRFRTQLKLDVPEHNENPYIFFYRLLQLHLGSRPSVFTSNLTDLIDIELDLRELDTKEIQLRNERERILDGRGLPPKNRKRKLPTKHINIYGDVTVQLPLHE